MLFVEPSPKVEKFAPLGAEREVRKVADLLVRQPLAAGPTIDREHFAQYDQGPKTQDEANKDYSPVFFDDSFDSLFFAFSPDDDAEAEDGLSALAFSV